MNFPGLPTFTEDLEKMYVFAPHREKSNSICPQTVHFVSWYSFIIGPMKMSSVAARGWWFRYGLREGNVLTFYMQSHSV